jgi:hypothetical protein
MRSSCRPRNVTERVQRGEGWERLFDDLVGASEQRAWESDVEHPRGLEIDHKRDFHRLPHRQLGCFLALEDPANWSGLQVGGTLRLPPTWQPLSRSARSLGGPRPGGRPAKTGLLNYANSSTSATGRRGFCGQFPGGSAPTDNSMTGTSSSASANSRATASASKPIIGVEPRPSARAA